jgi:Flp pilus assembly protein TadD
LAPDLAHLAGRIQAARSDSIRADILLNAAFAAEPEDPKFGSVLAAFLLERGEIESARDIIARSLEHYPGDRELLNLQESADEP